MRSENLKRLCAVLLSVMIIITMIPSLALADEGESDQGSDAGGSQPYKITVDFSHGKTSPVLEMANEGDAVTFTVVPDKDYDYIVNNSAKVKKEGGEDLDLSSEEGTFRFTMPASNVTITAEFNPEESAITINTAEHGKVLVGSSDESASTAVTGATVKLEVQPDEHYELKSLDCITMESKEPVELKEDTSGGTYTFTMPGEGVEVNPVFTETVYTLEAKTDGNGTILFTDDTGNEVNGAVYFGRVNLKVTPNQNYLLESIHAKSNDEAEIDYDDRIGKSGGRYYIKGMPDVNLIVSATFTYHTHEKMQHVEEDPAGCEKIGKIEYWYCPDCDSYFIDKNAENKVKRADLVVPATGHSWGAWKVTKEPTETEAGEKKRVCKNDSSHVETQIIPATGRKVAPTPKPENKPTTAPVKKSTKKTVLVAKASTGMNQVTLSWGRIKDADRYVIMFSKCNDNEKNYKVKKIKTVKANVLKYTVKKLENGRCYKYKIVAQKKSKGKYKNITKSLLSHTIIGNESWSESVPKSLKLNKKTITLKQGKSKKLKGKIRLYNSDKKIMSHAPALRFTTSDPSVATVSKSGKVKAKGTGTCTIYVQTINGICKKCKVTVK